MYVCTNRWLLDGEELVDGGEVELDSETGDLRITDLTYNNTGEYTCVAETGAGSDNVTHTVTISGEQVEGRRERGGEEGGREGGEYREHVDIQLCSVCGMCCIVMARLLVITGPRWATHTEGEE